MHFVSFTPSGLGVWIGIAHHSITAPSESPQEPHLYEISVGMTDGNHAGWPGLNDLLLFVCCVSCTLTEMRNSLAIIPFPRQASWINCLILLNVLFASAWPALMMCLLWESIWCCLVLHCTRKKILWNWLFKWPAVMPASFTCGSMSVNTCM